MPRDKPGQRSVNVYLDEQLARTLKAFAAMHDKALGDLVADFVVAYWAQHPHRLKFEEISESPVDVSHREIEVLAAQRAGYAEDVAKIQREEAAAREAAARDARNPVPAKPTRKRK